MPFQQDDQVIYQGPETEILKPGDTVWVTANQKDETVRCLVGNVVSIEEKYLKEAPTESRRIRMFEQGDRVTYIGPSAGVLRKGDRGTVMQDQSGPMVKCNFHGNVEWVNANHLE